MRSFSTNRHLVIYTHTDQVAFISPHSKYVRIIFFSVKSVFHYLYFFQEPKLPMKKTPKQTKSRSPRQNRSKSLKVSPVTLAVKAATVGAGQQINKKSGHLVTTSLPLQPRDGLVLQPVSVTSQMNSENGTKIVGNGGNLNQLITLHNDNSTLTAQVCVP